jgi:CBS domain-containing protein
VARGAESWADARKQRPERLPRLPLCVYVSLKHAHACVFDTRPQPLHTVTLHTPLTTALVTLLETGVSALPVVDEKVRPGCNRSTSFM